MDCPAWPANQNIFAPYHEDKIDFLIFVITVIKRKRQFFTIRFLYRFVIPFHNPFLYLFHHYFFN